MTTERNPRRMLAHLDARRRPGEFVFVSTPSADAALAAVAHAVVREDEGLTYVVERATTHSSDGDGSLRWAWITLGVHSALDAVGLTAAVSTALAAQGIACNMIAGQHHDHLLVPAQRCGDALATLSVLAAGHGEPA